MGTLFRFTNDRMSTACFLPLDRTETCHGVCRSTFSKAGFEIRNGLLLI